MPGARPGAPRGFCLTALGTRPRPFTRHGVPRAVDTSAMGPGAWRAVRLPGVGTASLSRPRQWARGLSPALRPRSRCAGPCGSPCSRRGRFSPSSLTPRTPGCGAALGGLPEAFLRVVPGDAVGRELDVGTHVHPDLLAPGGGRPGARTQGTVLRSLGLREMGLSTTGKAEGSHKTSP